MSETGKHGPKPQDQDVKFSRVAQTQAASPACANVCCQSRMYQQSNHNPQRAAQLLNTGTSLEHHLLNQPGDDGMKPE